MSKVTNIVIGSLVGAGLIGVYHFLMGKKETSDAMQTELGAKIISLNSKGLTVQALVKLKNPTSGTLTITQPTVELIHGTDVVATSNVGKKVFTLAARDEKQLDPITLTLPLNKVLSLAGSLLSILTKKQTVTLIVRAITNVDLGLLKKDFTQDTPITLKPKLA